MGVYVLAVVLQHWILSCTLNSLSFTALYFKAMTLIIQLIPEVQILCTIQNIRPHFQGLMHF